MACGACAQKAHKTTYVHTDKTGKKQVYKSEIEAKAAVARRGGTYSAQ